jgi:hypothetical protein
MVDSLDFSYLEKLTNKEKIDSHNSQLTNLRIHELEMSLDKWRIQMIRDPTQENIIGTFAVINAWFSYVQSIEQARKRKGYEFSFSNQIQKVRDRITEMNEYVSLIQKRIVSPNLKKKYPQLVDGVKGNTPWNKIEYAMLTNVMQIIDELRTIYQSMNFYFRTSKDTSSMGGILGDLIQAKKRGTKDPTLGENDLNTGPEDIDGIQRQSTPEGG